MYAMSWSDSPDDLWNLFKLSPKDLRYIYCDRDFWGKDALSWEGLRVRRKKLTKERAVPERETPFTDLDSERQRVAERRRTIAPKAGGQALKLVNIQIPEEHAIYHEQLQSALNQEGRVQSATFTEGEHIGFIKNADDEIELTPPLKNSRIKFNVKFDVEPKWPVVQRTESVIIAPRHEAKKRPDGSKRAIILPDPQIGYRLYSNGEYEPFHDLSALSVSLQIIRDVKPELVLCLGDYLDLPEFSKYEQTPEFARTTQKSIDFGHHYMATIRAMLPKSKLVVLEGNHDRRLEKHIKANAMAALSIKRAGDVTGWPVMSPPYLMAFDKLNVEYVEGYPAGRYWINERLQAIHGHVVRSGGSTAKAVADDENVSTVFGHVHRIEHHMKTTNTFKGGRTNAAYTPGTLARIDGAVPSVKGSTNLSGRPVQNYENWQQGIAVVDYQEGDSPFFYQQVYINTFNEHETRFNGKTYSPKLEMVNYA